MPNRLGFCGPDENEVIMEACVNNSPSSRLLEVLRGFQGAYPYLRFLAEHSGSGDPFHYQVTEAYWIGNDLLHDIPPDAFYKHLRKRFSAKFPREHVKKFFESRPYASFPHHSLHVFNAFSTMGTVPDSFASGKGPDAQVGQADSLHRTTASTPMDGMVTRLGYVRHNSSDTRWSVITTT
jgi:hypothetical protein